MSRQVLERRRVQSESRPGVFYDMARTRGGWEHDDEGCPWWLNRRATDQRKPCKHVIDLEKETAMNEDGDPGTSVVTYAGGDLPAIYALVDEFDAQLIVRGVAEERVEDWCYAFKQGSEVIVGLSIAGVPAAVREMAKHGEVIRCDDPRTVYEDENEVRLVCTARRVLVTPDGKEFELESTSRALRQAKKQKVNDWSDDPSGAKWPDGNPKRLVTGHHFEEDDKWFEKAHSKAVRNATLPLIRDDCRSAIIAAFKETPKYKAIEEGRQPQRSSRPARPAAAPRQAGAAAAQRGQRQPEGTKQDAMTVFWTASRQAGLDQDNVLNESQKRYGNREPKDLTPQERSELLAALAPQKVTGESITAAAPVAAPEHKHDPIYTNENPPRLICKDCEQELEEGSGQPAEQSQPSLVP